MSIFNYHNDMMLVWNELDLIDEFNGFIRNIRDTQYRNSNKSINDFFFEFYPIWDSLKQRATNDQNNALESRNMSGFINATIAPIQSKKNSSSDRSGKQNIEWFLVWLHAYHNEKAKEWFNDVRQHYKTVGKPNQIASYEFKPFEGDPPSFEDTPLAEKWGLVDKKTEGVSETVLSPNPQPFKLKDAVLYSLVGLLALTTVILWNQNSKSKKILDEYAIAKTEPEFNILYLDIDHIGRKRFEDMRNEHEPDFGQEAYAKLFKLPLVDFNLHQQLRDTFFNSFEDMKAELSEEDKVCLLNNELSELVTRTNTLFLAFQNIGGTTAYDVKIEYTKIHLQDRIAYNADNPKYHNLYGANQTIRFEMRPRGDAYEEIVEVHTIELGDIVTSDGRMIEIEAYALLNAEHDLFEQIYECGATDKAPALSRSQSVKVGIPIEYVPTSISYKTLLGEEIIRTIRPPNETPLLQSRGIIIRG